MSRPTATTRRLSLESLERREVPATGITLNAHNHVLTIEGSTANDIAHVNYNLVPGLSGAVVDTSTIQVTLQTSFGYQAEGKFRVADVNVIHFQGKKGADVLDNNTAIPSTKANWAGGSVNTSLLFGSPGNASAEQKGKVGVFTVGTTGTVEVDYLYKGAGYKGELGFYSLQGMESYTTGSTAYIKEAARRALSSSTLGHAVIQAQTQGARFSASLPWEGNLNSGTYIGPEQFAMTPGDTFAAILVPNGTLQQVYANPAITGDKRPLFSIPEANPYTITPQTRGQAGDLDGHGSIFAFEDLRLDGSSDRDYNDMVFQVVGARGVATPAAEVINSSRNFLRSSIGAEVLQYASARESSDTATVAAAGQAGTFKVGASGQVGINYLYDGGGYQGEMAVFSLQGMQNLTPGSVEFIREATRRALSDSVLGHVAISDRLEGARNSGGVAWETNYNQGDYQGVKNFQMSPGDTVAFMLVPNGTLWELYNNPSMSANKRPLFSLSTGNPNGPKGSAHLAAFNSDSTVLGFEDQRQDSNSDRDYNDMVFRVIGLEGSAPSLASIVNIAKNILNQQVASALLTP